MIKERTRPTQRKQNFLDIAEHILCENDSLCMDSQEDRNAMLFALDDRDLLSAAHDAIEECDGFSNYQTWLVHKQISNYELDLWIRRVKEYVDSTDTPTTAEFATNIMAYYTAEQNAFLDKTVRIYFQLLRYALIGVKWEEIADKILDLYEENVSRETEKGGAQ